MTDIKKGDLIITSRSRYGKVINIEVRDDVNKYLIRIGNKEHWIEESQLFKSQDAIRFKVTYEFDYIGKNIVDSIEVPIKKNTVIFDENGTVSLKEIVRVKINKQINQNVNILKITIS